MSMLKEPGEGLKNHELMVEKQSDLGSENNIELLNALIGKQQEALDSLQRELLEFSADEDLDSESLNEVGEIRKEVINLLIAMGDLERRKKNLEMSAENPSHIGSIDDLNAQLSKRFSFDTKDPQSSKENLQKIIDFINKNFPKDLMQSIGYDEVGANVKSLKDSDLIALSQLLNKNENLVGLLQFESYSLSSQDSSSRELLKIKESLESRLSLLSGVLSAEQSERKIGDITTFDKALYDQLKDPQQREKFCEVIRETIQAAREKAIAGGHERENERQAVSEFAAAFDKINTVLVQLFEISGGHTKKDLGVYEQIKQLKVSPTSNELSSSLSFNNEIQGISTWLENIIK